MRNFVLAFNGRCLMIESLEGAPQIGDLLENPNNFAHRKWIVVKVFEGDDAKKISGLVEMFSLPAVKQLFEVKGGMVDPNITK